MTLKTEDQARKCWCPFARVSVNEEGRGLVAANRGAVNPGCIASECMAWRWREKNSLMFADWRDENDELQGEARERKNYDGDEPRGYCGLAGKPEVK